MSHEKLNDSNIAAASKDADAIIILRDSEVRGFYYRFDPASGRGRWHVQGDQPRYDINGEKDGKRSVSITLGMAYPKRDQQLTPADARKLAGDLKRRLIAGDTFRHDGKVYQPRNLQRENAEAHANMMHAITQRDIETEKAITKGIGMSLAAAMSKYLKKYPRKTEQGRKEFESSVRRNYAEYIDLPVQAITPQVIFDEYDYRSHGSHKAMMNVRGILRFCDQVLEPRIMIDPLVFAKITTLGRDYNTKTKKAKALAIRDHMLPIILKEADMCADPWRDIIRLCLFTGLRKSEACSLRWSDVDLIDRSYVVADPKNSKPNQLPMSDQVHDLIAARQGRHDVFVFGSPDFAAGHPASNSGASTLSAWRDAVRFDLKKPDLTIGLHQLRKFCRDTLVMKLHCSDTLCNAITNHGASGVGQENYSNMLGNIEAKRPKLQELADHIDSLVRGS